MKAPIDIALLDNPDRLKPIENVSYPPIGFLHLWDDGGGGDDYGLYWPYGREQREPFVCITDHNSWGIELLSTSLGKFLPWHEAYEEFFHGEEDVDDDDVDEAPEIDDPQLPQRRFQAALKLCGPDPQGAIAVLEAICEDFPESAEVWEKLGSQRRRVGDHLGAGRAAIRAFASNWIFSMPDERILRMLRDAAKVPELAADPLVARSSALNLKFGGEKVNANYGLLRECIEAYLASDTPVLGLLLNQNYGFMMNGETISFQERHEFRIEEWYAEHIELCRRHLGDSRTAVG